MNAPLPKKLNHGRVKERYKPKPTERERDYHLWLMDTLDCICGCGAMSTIVHHPLRRHRDQRWRRDHEFVVPMNGHCHFALHQVGDEVKWRDDLALPEMASAFRQSGYEAGML